MFETYPKGGKTTHKKEKHEEMKSGWKGNPTTTSYPSKHAGNHTNTNKTKQSMKSPFLNGGGNKQVSANYPQSGGKNGKSFDTACNY